MRSLFLGTLSGVPLFSTVVFVLFSSFAVADQYFETKRYSHLTPDHCQEFDLNYFAGPLQFVTYSIDGAVDSGFTNEIRLARHEAAQMWRLLRDHKYVGPDKRWPITQVPRTQKILENLEMARRLMGFTYKVEGEILEAIVLIKLGTHFNPEDYFFTGGIEYSHGSGRVLGELDIIVARRSDCRVVVIGETKLGTHRLNKAKSQLARFANFLKSKGFGPQIFMYQ